MIEQLHNDIVKQITPPEYKYRAQVYKRNVRFKMNVKVDVSHINTADPIVKILVNECIKVNIDSDNHKCKIAPYTSFNMTIVMDRIGDYFCEFLDNNMPQQNPKVTKLYKWVKQYTSRHNIPTGSEEEYILLYRYLCSNLHSANHDAHVKNGIGILNTFKTKYEARGYEIREVRRGRRRRRW